MAFTFLCVYTHIHVEIRGQLASVGSSSVGPGDGRQAWLQVPFFTDGASQQHRPPPRPVSSLKAN